MEIKTFITTNLRSNCYILVNRQHAVVIDPGAPDDVLLDFIQASGVVVDAILLTHGHFDHIGGVMALKAQTGAPVYVSKADEDWLLDTTLSRLDRAVEFDRTVTDGDNITCPTMSFKVIGTPGHSEGGLCYLIEDILFSGDTLFYQSIGRTDIPKASSKDLYHSVKKLYRLLGESTVVYPGHGRKTTIGHEKQHNPFVRG